jgi:1-phosphofructokinase
MIYTVTLNPAIDRTIIVPTLNVGSVNRTISSDSYVGGKGINVSKVLKVLGAKSTALGFLGKENSQVFIDFFEEQKIDNNFNFVSGENRINIKLIERDREVITDINENGFIVTEDDIQKFTDRLVKTANEGDIVVLAGSLPKGVNTDIYKQLIQSLNKKNVKTILDASKNALMLGIEAIPYAAKPNVHELCDIVNIDANDEDSIISGGRKILDMGVKKLLISMGDKGSIYLSKEKALYANPIKVDVKNTVGAGDSMVAALTYGINKGLCDEDTLKLAAACGTAAVIKSGTEPPDADAIESISNNIKINRLV